MNFKHFFLPHPKTHAKAHLISTGAIAIYLAFFVTLQIAFGFINLVKPGVLGLSSNVSQQELIRLTNEERSKLGLSTLSENSELNQAALEKAKNMFAENYWAHYSPSGKDPWGFINGAGYKFIYAGENLAKNFYNSPDVVNAWMNSKTHRDNIVNSRYKDIGIAVLEGTLNGQPTILVVQEFGASAESLAENSPINIAKESVNIAVENESLVASAKTEQAIAEKSLPVTPVETLVANQKISNSPFQDPYLLSKNIGLTLVLVVGFLLLVDLYVIRRRAVTRLATRHLPHLALLGLAASTLINAGPIGQIL